MDGIDVSEQTNLASGEDATQDDRARETAAAASGSVETAVRSAPSSDDAELDAASLMEQFLNDPSHDYKTLKYGDVMDGVIMHLDRDEILVDIGSKSEGIVPSREYSSLIGEEKEALAIGDNVLVFVVQPENPRRSRRRQHRSRAPGKELAQAARDVRGERGHRGRSHQLQQGWVAGQSRWGARVRSCFAGDGDPRRRRG